MIDQNLPIDAQTQIAEIYERYGVKPGRQEMDFATPDEVVDKVLCSPPTSVRRLRVHGWNVQAREFTRAEIRDLDDQGLMDFICDEIVLSLTDDGGNAWSIDDLVYSECQAIVAAILEYNPNGRRGSR